MLVNTPKVTLIDDYAHHPEELRASITSVQRVFPDRTFVAIFQPHLYSRTRDLLDGFVEVLSMVDNVILLPIYPARELPIPGVTSEMLGGKVVQKAELADYLCRRVKALSQPVAVMTLGAGDIDRLVPEIADKLKGEDKR